MCVASCASGFALLGCQTLQDIPSIVEPAWTGPTIAGMFKDEPDIRVRVQTGSAQIKIGGAAKVVVRQAGAGTVSADLLSTPVTITSSAKGVHVVDGAGKARDWGSGNDMEVLASDGTAEGVVQSPTQSLTLNGVTYPGFVSVHPAWGNGGDRFDVIVSMGIESYLPGVLTHELFKDWPRQVYEANAIAARTYALHERSRARGERRVFDVEDTDADQVYGGATKSTLAHEATRATRGKVLVQDGKLIRAYFSSTCGGRSASAKDTWPRKPGTEFNLAPCLQGHTREHACMKATFYRWSVTRDVRELSDRIRAWGKQYEHKVAGLGRIRIVEVRSRNDADRPNTYTLTDDLGATFTMTAEELRTSSNWSLAGAGAITRENRVNSGDMEVEVYADQVRIRGRGWGHGVGMCQWCAKGFADIGWDWARMMKEFYPGAEVVQGY